MIYDANVLYPAPLRDLLIRLAQTTLVQARWSDRILDECFSSLSRNRPDLEPCRLDRTRALMVAAVRDCLVTGHDQLVGRLSLPDPDDRHVLAAAICAGAQAIVTFNLDDFPRAIVSRYEIEAIHPDRFVLDLIDADEASVRRVLAEQAAALGRRNPADICVRLARSGLPRTARILGEPYGCPD